MKQKIKSIVTYVLVIWFIVCVVSLMLVLDKVVNSQGFEKFYLVLHIVWSILFLATALLCGKKYLGVKNAMMIAFMMMLFVLTVVLFILAY